jgi:regulator of sigma E protease
MALVQLIVVFGLVLGAMIVIHEFGHFVIAKSFGVRIEVFSVGFGKRLWGIKKGDTDYRVSLIPLGGYVKMAGENLDDQVTGAPDEFSSKPKWQRFCVALGGPAANILTALMIPAVMAMIHHEEPAFISRPALVKAVDPRSPADKAGIEPGDLIVRIDGHENPIWRDVFDTVLVNPDQDVSLSVKHGNEIKHITMHLGSRPADQEKIGYSGFRPEEGKILVKDVAPDSPAAAAGMQVGDQIVGVNGNPIEQSQAGQLEIVNAIQNSGGNPVALTVERAGTKVELQGTPVMDGGNLRLGFTQEVGGLEMVVVRLGPREAFEQAIEDNLRILRLTGTALGQVFVGRRSARDTISGPVGIAHIVGEAAKEGTWSVFQVMGILSLNLGVFNLLPIPVLDGGMIFMLGLEAMLGIFGLPLTLRIKEKMMQLGLVVLALLMGFVIFNDISKRFGGPAAPQQQIDQARPAPNK